MNKKMREILAKIESKQNLAKGYTEGENKDLNKAKEILNEIKVLKEEYEVEKQLFENEKEMNKLNENEVKEVVTNIENKKNDEEGKSDSTKSFAKAVRGIISNKDMTEGNGEDGGYTVPEEIITKVERLRESKPSLKDLITVKKVKTNSGKETYKTRGEATGFSSVDEKGKIPKAGAPKFSRLTYEIAKYAGYMPVTNELLQDSDENIEALMIEWLADESRATWNNLILAVIAQKAAVALKDLDGIKKALNVTLGSLFKSTSKIITNDDGLNYLDTLKDKNGRDLLQPDPTEPAKLRLRAGATTVPVVVFDNQTIKTKIVSIEKNGTTVSVGQIPFIIGDLKEGIKGFDRQELKILASQTAIVGSGDDVLNAYEEDLTLIRGIEREDVEMRDKKALVNGYIEVAAADVASQEEDEEDNNENEGV